MANKYTPEGTTKHLACLESRTFWCRGTKGSRKLCKLQQLVGLEDVTGKYTEDCDVNLGETCVFNCNTPDTPQLLCVSLILVVTMWMVLVVWWVCRCNDSCANGDEKVSEDYKSRGRV